MKYASMLFITLLMNTAHGADFTMSSHHTSTINVAGCEQATISIVRVTPTISGEHILSAKCLPLVCTYNYQGGWVIKLMAKTENAKGIFSDPQFIRSSDMVQTLKTDIKSKAARDSILREYVQSKVCVETYHDINVPSM